ncbi:hypothetical protein DL769_011774 [Monosporascus sp. CRB-8-3]|nr:hypothetical protein DL769_011774 [Monosporascus sp. CRB-8-3]
MVKAEQCLGDLQKHVILWISVDEQPEALSLAPVGPELLLTVTLGAPQIRLVRDSGNAGDLISVLRERTPRLPFPSRSKPSKKLFTEIKALENDLEALSHITNCQVEKLGSTRAVLDPRSFEYVRTAPADAFEAEFDGIDELEDLLLARDFEICQLQEQAEHLRMHVMRAIVVLEEGHVRAIRVFTVGLFLPAHVSRLPFHRS